MRTDDEKEFKGESVKDVIKTKNEFKKRGGKDKGLQPSSHNTDAYKADEADEASKSKYESKIKVKSKKVSQNAV